MQKSQIDSAALLALAVAAALALMLLPGSFAWLASIGGLTLVFILLAYDRDGYRSVFQSLAFAAVFGFCLMLAVAIILKFIAASYGQTQPASGPFATEWLPVFWACITVIFWPIDRARMTGRLQYGGDLTMAPVSGPIVTPRFNAPIPVTTPPAASFVRYEPPAAPPPPPAPAPAQTFTRPQPEPAAYAPSVPPPPPPAPAPAQTFTRPQPEPAAYAPPVAPPPPPAPAPRQTFTWPPQAEPAAYAPPAPVPPPPSPVPTQTFTWPQPEPAAYAPAPAMRYEPAPPPPPPVAAPPPMAPVSGREAMIYVSLVGEGLNVLRSVRAEHLGRDFYRIVDTVPEGEIWEYGPGQVVRCKKKNLSTGKGLVAVEEAPRAQ